MGLLAALDLDAANQALLRMVFGILSFFTVLFYTWRALSPRAFLREMIDRTVSWWAIVALYVLFFCIHPALGFVGLGALALASFRELTGKLPAKTIPRSLMYLSYGVIPLQFYMSYRGDLMPVAVLIPVAFFASALVACLVFEEVSAVLTGPAVSLWALLLTTYGLSHLALLLSLPPVHAAAGIAAAGLCGYYLFLTQFNDVLQFLWGAFFGRHPISPKISPKKTWEGFLGGAATTAGLAYLLRFMTPFTPQQSIIVGALLAMTGFLGDLTLSAFKRSLDLKDMGNVIPGHGGILDRVDSVTLSSLTYFYLIYYWYYA